MSDTIKEAAAKAHALGFAIQHYPDGDVSIHCHDGPRSDVRNAKMALRLALNWLDRQGRELVESHRDRVAEHQSEIARLASVFEGSP